MKLGRTTTVSFFVSGLAVGLGALAFVASLTGCDSPGLSGKGVKTSGIAQEPPGMGAGKTTTTSASMAGQNGAAGLTSGTPPTVFTQGLSVSDAVAKACGIAPRGDGKTAAPSFEFDSATLGAEDREMLAQVAKCVTEGALRGKSLKLTGRSDPRGEPEYNMTLGESRSDGVKRYMIDLGVGREKLNATSRGEIDATGKDEAGWAHDRRVDIDIAE